MNDRLYLIDASVQIFRAWHSLEPRFNDQDGFPVDAVYGFTSFLLTLLEQEDPSQIAICFDESLETSFRNDLYPEYKANRDRPPRDLRRQFNGCRAISELLGLPSYSSDRYEADDLIGTLRSWGRQRGLRAVIVSSDKDLCQLVGPEDLWWDFSRQRRLDHDGVEERFGVPPSAIADLLALTGDPVDNIPGVTGVGVKSAAKLLQHFGDIDALLARVDEVPFLKLRGARTIARNLRAEKESLLLSRQLTRIYLDAPLPEPISVQRQPPATAALDELLDQLRFGRLIRQRIQALRP